VLVTGGLGFIGSHTSLELLLANYRVVVIDNLINAKEEVRNRVETLAGKSLHWYNVDLLNYEDVEMVFKKHRFDAVIHFAALKAVGESVEKPLRYYHHNLVSTMHILRAMEAHECFRLVFSSSACVYGVPRKVPLKEEDTRGPIGDAGHRASAKAVATNPYGNTKVIIERVLEDLAQNPKWEVVALRYFNPVGAHPSGCIGEDPHGIPNNLMPYLLRVAKGEYQELTVYGSDYPTRDGTGVRDFIHVVDLATGHVAALANMLSPKPTPGFRVYNLGTGNGFSVLEMVAEMERASGTKIRVHMAPRRPGDVPENFADATQAHADLGWNARLNMKDMCRDSWRFAQGQCDPNFLPNKKTIHPAD